MIQPRLHIHFSRQQQKAFCFGDTYIPHKGEYLLNHARSGIVMALQAILPNGGRVGVIAYNCHTVANAILEAGCTPVLIDVTEDLHIDIADLANKQMDAMVLTNLFGIHNDLAPIQLALAHKPIIVDNAHGSGLPAEGDCTVYSINQGKFPSLGEGGILIVNNQDYIPAIDKQYADIPAYTAMQEAKLFATMLLKSIAYHPWIYGHITMRMKHSRTIADSRQLVILRKMANGISRMYQNYIASNNNEVECQLANAALIQTLLSVLSSVQTVWWGDNAFMAIARCKDVSTVQQFMAEHGVETATHFANCISWAKQLGYQDGSCPIAEKLVHELVMIPTYKTIRL